MDNDGARRKRNNGLYNLPLAQSVGGLIAKYESDREAALERWAAEQRDDGYITSEPDTHFEKGFDAGVRYAAEVLGVEIAKLRGAVGRD